VLLKGLMFNNVHSSFNAYVSNNFTLASDALAHTAGLATAAALAAFSATVIIMTYETVCCCIGSNGFLVALAGA
jgi:hypothetical protein